MPISIYYITDVALPTSLRRIGGHSALSGLCMAHHPQSIHIPTCPTQCGDMLIIDDSVYPLHIKAQALAQLIFQTCLSANLGLVCDFEKTKTPFFSDLVSYLDALLHTHQLDLWIPESYATHSEFGNVMVSSELSGGYWKKHICEMIQTYPSPIVLQLLPISMDFTLPCPTGCGRVLTPTQRECLIESYAPKIHYSPQLVCQYYTYVVEDVVHFVLFDNRETLLEKIEIAHQLGVGHIICLYDELGDLFP